MPTTVLTAIGGLGLFLSGMLILTDGLKNLVGAACRRFWPAAPTVPLVAYLRTLS
jgi:Na+/phosphate symporter